MILFKDIKFRFHGILPLPIFDSLLISFRLIMGCNGHQKIKMGRWRFIISNIKEWWIKSTRGSYFGSSTRKAFIFSRQINMEVSKSSRSSFCTSRTCNHWLHMKRWSINWIGAILRWGGSFVRHRGILSRWVLQVLCFLVKIHGCGQGYWCYYVWYKWSKGDWSLKENIASWKNDILGYKYMLYVKIVKLVSFLIIWIS